MTTGKKEIIELTQELLEYLAIDNPLRKCDLIWGLGSANTDVAVHAAGLYSQKLAEQIVFSGGQGHRWMDLPKSEAQIFKQTAIDHGVPESAIITEDNSTNTGENILFTIPLFKLNKLQPETIILTTIPPFQRRACAAVKQHMPELKVINSPGAKYNLPELDDKEFEEVCTICVGEIERLQKYPSMGFINFNPEEIPAGIITSARRLASLIASD